MIALIDYDAGNIKSVEKAFQSLGKEVVLTRDPDVLKRADHVVLPGVGSFGDAMENLNRYHLVPVIHEIVEKGTPFLPFSASFQAPEAFHLYIQEQYHVGIFPDIPRQSADMWFLPENFSLPRQSVLCTSAVPYLPPSFCLTAL